MPLDIVVVMDPIGSIKVAKDSTFAMLLEGQRRGHRLHYVLPGGLALDAGEAVARAAPLKVRDDPARWFELGPDAPRPFRAGDVVLMRRDPPVDAEYLQDTHVLDIARRAGAAGNVEHMGVLQVLGVDWRIAAHQHHVACAERARGVRAEFEPARRVVADLQRRGTRHGLARVEREPTRQHVVEAVAPALTLQQHREGRILGDLDRPDRVHHDDDVKGHGVAFEGRACDGRIDGSSRWHRTNAFSLCPRPRPA